MLAPDYEFVRRVTANNARGELGPEIPLWLSMPTLLDRSLVPEGSDGHSLYLYVPAVPHRLSNGDWGAGRDGYLDRCLDVMETHLPGARSLVLGAASKSPADLESMSYKGNIFGVDMSPAQIGPWRPVPSLAGYKTPIEGLWHASASTHPAPAVSGWAGRTAARTILREMRT